MDKSSPITENRKLTAIVPVKISNLDRIMNDEPKDLLLIGDSMISKLKTGIAQNYLCESRGLFQG